jgi:hypothetical protein
VAGGGPQGPPLGARKIKLVWSWRGGHFNAGRKSLRESGYVEETNDLLSASVSGLKAAGEVPPAPSTPAERLALWCDRLPSPAPEMLRTLAAQGASARRTP